MSSRLNNNFDKMDKINGRTFWDWISENRNTFLLLILLCLALVGFAIYRGYNIRVPAYVSIEHTDDSQQSLEEKTTEEKAQDNRQVEENIKSKATSKISHDYFIVVLELNSNLSNGRIFVDGSEIAPFEDNLIIKKIKIPKKNTSYNFKIVDGKKNCEANILISKNNQTINICDI